MHTKLLLVIALSSFAVLSSGCGAVNRALQERIAKEALAVAPPVEDDAAVAQVATETAEGERAWPEEIEIPAEAGLEDYIGLALQRNPGIRQAIRTVQALGFRVPQVTSLEDPMITLIPPTGDMTETAAGMMDAQVGISQKLPFPGKLRRRGRIAEQEARMSFAALADARIRTAAEVTTAYYEYYLAHISLAITDESERLLRQIRDVASARYRAGTATQQDVLRSEVELYALINEKITLDQRGKTAQARLNMLMNRRVDSPLPPPKPFQLETVDWRLPQAMDRAVESNPSLARLREQVERDLESIRLARLEYFPDLRVGFNYTFIGPGISPVATGDDNWNLPLGLNLPIWWKRLRAQVLEQNAKALASVEQYEAMRNMVFFGLQDTLVKIDTQFRQAVLFRDLLIPRAWQTVEVSTSAYQAGSLEFTALIDNWRKWLEFSLLYHRALAQLEQRFADLQQLIGVRVPRAATDDTVPRATPIAHEGSIER